jgi:hypothetical protein
MGLATARRLSHPEKCAAFYCMQRGFPQRVVAKAFGITTGTASLIANCLNPRARPLYRKVAEEWVRLGKQEFGEKYYNSEWGDRLAAVKLKKPVEKLRPSGPNPRATAHVGFHYLPETGGQIPLVEIHQTETGAFVFSDVSSIGEGEIAYRSTSPTRHDTSYQALVAAHRAIGFTDADMPRPFPPKLDKPPELYPNDETTSSRPDA